MTFRSIINYQLLNCQVFEWFQDRDIRCNIHYFLHSNLHCRMNNFLCCCHHRNIHHLDDYCNTGYRVFCPGIQRHTLPVQIFRQQKNQPLLIYASRCLRHSQEPKTRIFFQFSRWLFQKIPFCTFSCVNFGFDGPGMCY